MKNLLLSVAFLFGMSAEASLVCNGSGMNQVTMAQCILKSLVENTAPPSFWENEVQKQVQELKSKGLEVSGEYSAIFLGGNQKDWTYIASVDFYKIGEFQSIAVAIKTSPDGTAEIKKVFSKDEIENLIH